MIHYRISPTNDNQLNPKIYRSLRSLVKDFKSIGGCVYAYANYKDATTEQTENRLILKTDISGFILERPKLITKKQILEFVDNSTKAKSVNPHRCNASNRDYFRSRYGLHQGMYLFGFDNMERAINARIYFDISCSYNRTTSPIFINNKKSNRKGLLKYID